MTEGDPEWAGLVGAQVNAIRAGTKTRRLRFRLLEIVCSRCGGMVGEVLNTTPGPVLIFRQSTEFDEQSDLRHEFRMHLLSVGPLDAGGRLLFAGCTCSKHGVNLELVRDAMAAKQRKVALKPREHDASEPTSKEVMRLALKSIGRKPPTRGADG